ncbi:MAG: amino acid permease [Nanoarchaeota archaeon]|nr:amino acid permease [Nanoarchaeota archaeon]
MLENQPKIDTTPFDVEKKITSKGKNPAIDSSRKEKSSSKPSPYKFSTFTGVFVPSVLAIFGAVMYLILPKVLGSVGLFKIIIIILLAHSVSIASAFSLSAIATNIKVKGGGLYYLISRSLGSEFGGGLGIQLYLAQTVGTSFYIIAFAIGVQMIFAALNIALPVKYIAFVACILFGVLVYVGAKFVIKVQYFILAAIVLSLFSVFLGPSIETNIVTLVTDPGVLPFWVAFAMFFPAVTGIDAGVGMSGDLKNPKKSLVKGTFAAISVTLIIYLLLAIKLANAATFQNLAANEFVILNVSFLPVFVILGILLATASSALSYFMSAPRTLRAMSDDNIFPQKLKFLSRSIGNSPDPRVALIFTLMISAAFILYGNLSFVSQVVTIFFLNVYGWINAAAFFEKISGNPSYRPSFNSPLLISFYGMVISYLIMYLFNPVVMFISIIFQAFVFFILYKTKTSIKLESVWDGVLFQLLRGVMNKIEKTEKSKKNWRPTIVAFGANEINRNAMFSLLDWIGSNRGIMKFYFLITGNIEKGTKNRQKTEEDMKSYIKENGLDLFPRVIETEDIKGIIEAILQSETIGNLPVNTALIDFDKEFKLNKLIKLTAKLKKNVIILRNNAGFSDFKFVDIWYDDPDNGNLMILIAYLITHSETWKEKDASIRLFRVVSSEKELDAEKSRLTRLIENSRIDNITLKVMVQKKTKKIPQIIKENSHYADLVIMGMPHKKKGISSDITKEIKKYTDGLTTSLIVLANDKIDFKIN